MSHPRFIILPSVALLVAAGARSATAQQRVDVNARRAPVAAENEPASKLRRQLDSLTQRYNEGEELTTVDRRRIEVEIGQTVDRLAELMSRMGDRLQAHVMLRAPMQTLAPPRGWIGIVAEGAGMEPRVENGEVVVRYLSYPRIVSVDPSSPAQAAGIVPNDTLLAYDGRDVRENDIYLNHLLRPLARVNVKVRHDGRVREVPVVVAEAPSRIVLRRDDEARDDRALLIATAPDGAFGVRIPAPVSVSGMARGSVRPAASGTTAPPSPGGIRMFSFDGGGVAGAQLVTITEGLGKRLGVANGVLVTSAPVGSPAYQSGIEDGDVLVKVGDTVVRSLLDVRRAVGAANENGQHAVDVVLLRDKATVRTVLRW